MKKIVHESGKLHVTGEAIYVDDMAVSDQLLHVHLYTSPFAHAKIKSYDLKAAKAVEGVKAILDYKDVPHNQMGPIIHDEIVLAEDTVQYIGHPIFIIGAETNEAALEAKKLIKIEFEELEAVLTIEKAIEKGQLLQAPRKIETGNIEEAFKNAKNIIDGELVIGGQEHWYLETQTALVIPLEYGEMKVFSSTQNPSETQALVAEVLGLSKMQVEVDMRRMGGGFGGKESQASHYAIFAALIAQKTKRPAKIRLFRDEDQKITGKRHRFIIKYKAAYDNEGVVSAIDFDQNIDAGWATDLTMSILERAMMHAENSYFIPNMRIIGKAWRTNLPSNTAYRGFGGPQGIAAMETILDRIARNLKVDASEIRFRNFLGMYEKNTTPYGQAVENNRLYLLWDQLIKSSDYQNRRNQVNDFNNKNEFKKRGLALTPVKFGISFTTSFLNQAGALVHVYNDGSVLVNHGGTEMGQGLHTKMRQVAAIEFGIDYEKVRVNATNTAKVPNTSPTAASSGTDMNGMAVKNACDILCGRIAEHLAEKFNAENKDKNSIAENFVFENNNIYDSANIDRTITFKDAVWSAYFNQVGLSSTGFYKTPGIYFDRANGVGNPFFYFSFGMSVSEIELDVLTGRTKFLRADILHDCGDSINPNIDKGQVEGAFIQGVGWVTTEEMKYDKNGNLLNHSPDTYKIPSVQDIPEIFNVELLQNAPNPNTIHKSKAVGEPPFVLGFSTWFAIKDAISAVKNHEVEPQYFIPATNENILLSIEKMKK